MFCRIYRPKHHIEGEFNEFNNWDDFLIISRDVKENDAFDDRDE